MLQHLVERGGLLGGIALARGDQQEPPVTPGAALRARDHLPREGPGHDLGDQPEPPAAVRGQRPRPGVGPVAELVDRLQDPPTGLLGDGGAGLVVEDEGDGGPRDTRVARHIAHGHALRLVRGHFQSLSAVRRRDSASGFAL